jgi:glycosyltransferase involved in cell wall biosynthesis
MNIEKLSIVVPAYNEERTIIMVLERLISIQLINSITKEIIVVNDASTDATSSLVRQFIGQNKLEDQVRFIEQPHNQGKGAAIRKGIQLATGHYIIIQDADLEYDPQEFNILLKPIIDGYADVVYGSRFMGGRPHRILFFWHSIGNKFLTTVSNVFTNLNLTDMETCYKLFKADILKKVRLQENRFGFEPEVTSKISIIPGIRIYEVGISYYGRSYAEGKKIRAKDGFRALYCILKYYFIR